MKKDISDYSLAGIGELLWDVLPEGEMLGGAPVNFAYYSHALGATGVPISTVGDDRRGRLALEELRLRGLDTSAISILADFRTGFVDARLDEAGVATYHFPDDVAWDHLQVNARAKSLGRTLDAVCFGSLALRSEPSRKTILGYLDGLPSHTKRVLDVNLRQDFFSSDLLELGLRRADILKLNDDELAVLSRLWELPGPEETSLHRLLERYQLELLIFTRGGRGSLIISPHERSSHPGLQCDVVDTIGAGDSFTAMAILCYLQSMDLDTINENANRLAAHVCCQAGAMVTPIPDFTSMS